MTTATFEGFLLSEDDLDDDFFGEDPTAAYDPVFLSGDESGRFLIDFVNDLTHGTHPGTRDHASALFTSAVGSVVFHNVTLLDEEAGRELHAKFLTAVRECGSYRMALNDGVEFDVAKTGLEEEGDITFVRWFTTADPYRIEGHWAVSLRNGFLSFVNTRHPGASEIRRLAGVALDRISTAPGS